MKPSRLTVYLKVGCPHSMRLRIFLAEAKLEDGVEIVAVESGSDVHHRLSAAVKAEGHLLSYPLVEHASGRFEMDSRTIIDRMAGEHGIDPRSLSLLRFYEDGMIPRFGKMFMELKRLKGHDWNGEL